jgi:hypothetical protein
MNMLATDREFAKALRKPMPSGLGITIRGKQIQVDLV